MLLRSLKELVGYKLAATDGEIGKVKDFLFDEALWTIRWMVADTGTWLPGRKVLISPMSLGEPDWQSSLFPVHMTNDEVAKAPGLNTDEPVSRQYETQWFDIYGWPYYWIGAGAGGPWGGVGHPGLLLMSKDERSSPIPSPEQRSDVVRSAKEVMSYSIECHDGEIGQVEDFIVDDESWTVRYVVVDTRTWLPGRKVLVPSDSISAVKWADSKMLLDVTRDVVKNSPKYEPSAPINREYETRLYDYYGRPVYW